MFVGHYSAAFAGKTVAPRIPLWVLMLAAQLVDVAWALLVLVGIERFTLDATLPSNPLVLEYMPFTHSLAAGLVWAGLAGAVVLAVPTLGGTRRAALVVGAVVLSHWVLDLVVHRPDLTLAGGGPRLGFGLWNHPRTAFLVEVGLLAATAAGYATRSASAAAARAVACAVLVLVLLQTATLLGPIPPSTTALAVTMLVAFSTLALAAARIERRRDG